MVSCNVKEIKKNGYVIETRVQVPLTGKNIHEFTLYPGEGYFSIGVKGINKDHMKTWVNKDDVINWGALDDCNIRNWPRSLYYTGNDISFVTWSQKRRIEDFTWKPLKKMKIDFSKSMIDKLYIDSDYELKLIFGNKIGYLDLYGDPNKFLIEKCDVVPSLGFYPKKDSNLKIYQLPKYNCFKNAKELLIKVDSNGAPFDCSSILQFSELELLHLIGNMTNLYALKELKNLKKLGFWDAPNLSGIPPLDSWKNLNKFVAMNIDEKVGKKLKKELIELKKVRHIEFGSITKLRNKLWFETECGIPFSQWIEENEKKATSAYKKCLKSVKKAQSEDELKVAIIEFTNKMNTLEDIETMERDDIYTALCLIMKNSPVEIEHDKWFLWFDETRKF